MHTGEAHNQDSLRLAADVSRPDASAAALVKEGF